MVSRNNFDPTKVTVFGKFKRDADYETYVDREKAFLHIENKMSGEKCKIRIHNGSSIECNGELVSSLVTALAYAVMEKEKFETQMLFREQK